MATLSGAIGSGSKWLLDKIVGAIAATGINPNLLTFLGLVVNFGAAAFFAVGRFFVGALIIFFAGFLDILDGQVARRSEEHTSELQSRSDLVCRLLLEKKNIRLRHVQVILVQSTTANPALGTRDAFSMWTLLKNALRQLAVPKVSELPLSK